MFTLSDDSIAMLKKDAKLNHESGLKHYKAYVELVNEGHDKTQLRHFILLAMDDFENAMNLYGTIKLYRENFKLCKVSQRMYSQMKKIFEETSSIDREKG